MFEKLVGKIGYKLLDWELKKYQKAVGPLIDDHRIYKSLRELLGPFSGVIQQPYKQSVWVYAAINTIISNISRVPFVIRKDRGEMEPATIEEGPLYELFQNPNPLMTQSKLIETTFGFYELYGECFWILEGRDNVTQIPKEIWTFNPTRFEPIIDRGTGWLLGWKYVGKTEVIFSLNEILHFKMFNPYDDLRGLSPLEAARLSVESEYHASMYNKVFFENGAVTSLNISVPEELNDEQYNRMLKQFEDRHKGSKKAHRIVIAESGAKIIESRIGQRDMEFIDGKKMSRTEILAAYEVNEVVLGIFADVKSQEGSKAAHKAFWEECLVPKIMYFEEVLWAKFFSKIGVRKGKGKIWGEFDLATVASLQENYADKVDMAKKLWDMGWPINMINKRLKLGMQDVGWGNEAYVPGGYASYSYILANGGAQNQAPGKDNQAQPTKAFVQAVAEAVKTLTAVQEPSQISSPSPEVPLLESSDPYKSCKNTLSKEYKGKVGVLLFNQRKIALENIFASRKVVHNPKGYDKLTRELKEVYQDAVRKGCLSVWQDVGASEEAVSSPDYIRINEFVDGKVAFIVGNFKDLIDNLTDAFDRFKATNSPNNDVLADKMRDIYNYLTQKSYSIAEAEIESSFVFGRNLETSIMSKKFKEIAIITSTIQ